jgi:tetratricopeptide (TPR) repeat protein
MTTDNSSANEDLLASALGVAETVEGEERSELLEAIAVEYCRRGNLETALELAESIQDPYLRERTIGTLAALSFDVQAPDQANELLDSIEDPSLVAIAIEQTSVRLAERGEFEEAIRLTDQLADPADALSNIAVLYAQKGNFEEAIEVAQMIEPAHTRTTTFGQLATELIGKGRNDEALELLGEATESAEAIDFPEDQVYALAGLASVYEKLGERDSAFEILTQAQELCGDIESSAGVGISATSGRDQALSQIVGALASLNFFEKADSVLEEIEDPFQFSLASMQLAEGYHKDGRQGPAKELLDQAVEITREPELTGERGIAIREQVLSLLAYRYALFGYFDESLKLAESLTGMDQKTGLLVDIGRQSVVAGRDTARVGNLLTDPARTTTFWLAISDAHWEATQTDEAERALVKAQAGADTIDSPYEKSLALTKIASRLNARQQTDRARIAFNKARSIVDTIAVTYQQARILLELAQVQRSVNIESGQTERAAFLEPETVWISSNPIME